MYNASNNQLQYPIGLIKQCNLFSDCTKLIKKSKKKLCLTSLSIQGSHLDAWTLVLPSISPSISNKYYIHNHDSHISKMKFVMLEGLSRTWTNDLVQVNVFRTLLTVNYNDFQLPSDISKDLDNAMFFF